MVVLVTRLVWQHLGCIGQLDGCTRTGVIILGGGECPLNKQIEQNWLCNVLLADTRERENSRS